MPTQALFFLNDPFLHTKSEKFAARLQSVAATEAEQIELASRLTVGRTPTEPNGLKRPNSCKPTEPSWRIWVRIIRIESPRGLSPHPVWIERVSPLRLISLESEQAMQHHNAFDPSRRGVLRSMIGGSLLLPGIVSQLLAEDSGRPTTADPLAPKPTHFPAKAKRVIFLYMSGGVSHVDSWDPKPKLFEDAGKTVSVNEFQGRKGDFSMFLKRPQWDFAPHGQSGTQVSGLFPHMAECVDDICVIRSMKSDHTNHYEATLGIHTGSFTFARPSIGSWLSYGLGTVNRNLPSFVVIAPQSPYAGGQVWGSDFLPGSHQGTLVVPGPEPVANIQRRAPSSRLQELELAALSRRNERHLESSANDPLLAARIKSFETAFGMQAEMPEVFDLSKETDATLKLYGLERGSTKGFAWQCLVARRLAERGVRFVELIDVGSSRKLGCTRGYADARSSGK